MRTQLPLFASVFASLLVSASTLEAQNQGILVTSGVDTYVEIPHHPDLVPQGGITLEAWVTYDESTLGSGWYNPTIARHNMAAGQETFMLRVEAENTRKPKLRWLVAGTAGTLTLDWNFGAGGLTSWTHLAATYDGSEAHIYANGVLVASKFQSVGPLRTAAGVMRIGTGNTLLAPGIEAWNGQIDEVRLWGFARTAAEIQQTMPLELQLTPVGASNWSLNGDALDSAAGTNQNPGSVVGQLAFVQNSLSLTSSLAFALPHGAPSQGCGTNLSHLAPASLGKRGSTLGLRGLGASPGSSAFFMYSGQELPTAINVLGLDLWLDPTTLGILSTPAVVSSLGTSELQLPIPAVLPPIIVNWQILYFDTACTPAGLAASDAIRIGIQP